jgi:amino-acid N-acetyltransferase
MIIRAARGADRASVEALLSAASLPLDGVAEHFDSFVVAEGEGRVVGAAGLEWYGDAVLLRSVVVHDDSRASGLGSALTQRALDDALGRGARAVFLLTTTAETFFERLGFERIARQDVPPSMRTSRELQGACPASAIVMRRGMP